MTLRTGCSAALEALRDLFFPAHCAGCNRALSTDWLCASCREDLESVPEPRCETCSQPFDGAMERLVCENCRDREFYFDCAVGVMRSKGVLRDLIHRLKYSRELWLAQPLGGLLATGLDDERFEGRCFDAIVPVPLHPLRQREREFNQSELLGRELSRIMGKPMRNLLKRVRNTVTQTHFDRRHRMQNLRDAFILRQDTPLQGQQLLLVDDVFTTGSTLDECARILLNAGANNVCALTLARG